MIKTTNKFAPEVGECAVRMVANHERDHPSRWAAMVWIAEKTGCVLRRQRGGTQTSNPRLLACSPRTSRSTACARSGGRLTKGANGRNRLTEASEAKITERFCTGPRDAEGQQPTGPDGGKCVASPKD